jgi:hypothetical protein
MPIFPNSSNINASGSIFNDFAGDQIFHLYTIVSGLTPDQISQVHPSRFYHRVAHPTADDLRPPPSGCDDLSQRRLLVLSNTAGGIGDILSLITEIKSLIGRSGRSSCSFVALELELDLLHQTLSFTSLGIKSFQWTLLGQSLAKTINPKLVRCAEVLLRLHKAIDTFREGLWYTSIWSVWRLVWSSAWEVDELVIWRRELFHCRRSLGMIVRAMYR